MILAVSSGKGGTGKTTVAVSLAYLLSEEKQAVRLLDCDVEEPNDHLFVQPVFHTTTEVTAMKPRVDLELCDGCGKCAEACHYQAIAVVKKKVLIFNELCHSCGVCTYVCPQKAISEHPEKIGSIRIGTGKNGFFFCDGLLNIGESLSPFVVGAVKKEIDPSSINILDTAPGTACPVVEALENVDVALLVTEPTPFGLNDLKLAAAMAITMKIPTGIVINRSDGCDEIIESWSRESSIPILGRIPFRREYASTCSSGGILAEEHKELRPVFQGIYDKLLSLSQEELPPIPIIEELSSLPLDAEPPFSDNGGRYKEITVISGKGGTGKTTVVASFAALSEKTVFADNDVDAADLHLLLTPRVQEIHPFLGGKEAIVSSEDCIACGECAKMCHFDSFVFDGPGNAMVEKTWRIPQWACEGCGLCEMVCPVKAISLKIVETGKWYLSSTAYGPMTHARLAVGGENSGRLVSQVRTRASELAKQGSFNRIIGDGPPGTGCPVIASVTGTDLVLIVTEPTVSGVHDLERVLGLTRYFQVPSVVIINKADLNPIQEKRIEELSKKLGAEVIARIPFDPEVNEALKAGEILVRYSNGPAAKAVTLAWEKLKKIMHA
ncbi:MAG: ATP-binding protein [Candidatus Ratteibacteria bacterium]|jgi:MinD superfamily P-loop ATPase